MLFGLLHGQGFAGALKEAGVPQGSFLLSLLSFNVGVELGQLVVAAVALSLVGLSTLRQGASEKLARGGSMLIALAGLLFIALRLI